MPHESDFDPRWTGSHIVESEWHFHRQLFERYGVVLGIGQFSKIVNDIRSGRAILVRARDKRCGLYSVRVKGAERVFVLAVNGLPRTAWPTRHAKRLLKKAKL
jgi:hypothetical protein